VRRATAAATAEVSAAAASTWLRVSATSQNCGQSDDAKDFDT
jgi:hypothetical protein